MIDVTKEVEILKAAIFDFGTVVDGKPTIEYGILFDKTANTLEALNGTLRAAKRQKLIKQEKELLMMPGDAKATVVWIGE